MILDGSDGALTAGEDNLIATPAERILPTVAKVRDHAKILLVLTMRIQRLIGLKNPNCQA